MEVRLVIARLLWNFTISRGEDDWDWYSQKAYFVWEKNPLLINVSVGKDRGLCFDVTATLYISICQGKNFIAQKSRAKSGKVLRKNLFMTAFYALQRQH